MTTQVSTKVRFVICPRCREVLLELPGVSVYKCGGCGTILQAKNRKPETNETELPPQERDSVAKQHQDNVLGQEEELKVESLPDRSVSGEDSPVKAEESPEYNSSGRNPEGYQSKRDVDCVDPSVVPTSSDELPSSGEITLEDEVYTPDAGEHLETHNQSDVHQDNRVDQKEDEVRNLPEIENQETFVPENYENEEFDGGMEHNGLAHENDVASPSRREKNASPVSFCLTSDDENLDHSQSEAARNFERVSSVDTLGSTSVAYVSAELDFEHGSVTDYPRNGSYYAYDGSESSYDGTDDQIFKRTSHPSRKNTILRKDGFRRDSVVRSEPERTYWGTGSSHRAMRSSHWNRGTTAEASRYNRGHRMGLDKQGDTPGFPFTRREPLTGHRTVTTSGYRHSSLPPRPGVNLPNKPSYVDPDKLDLLRTVCELKDRLNRMHFNPFRYDHLAPNRDLYQSDQNGYNSQHYHAKSCNASRMAFSGEAAHRRHHVSCSHLHCCRQDWPYSAQLPSRNCCSASSSPSLHHCTGSEVLRWGHEAKPNNRRLYLREKYHSVKRHLRPVAGGAPVVACYHCLELLHLPADFLLFKRRYHRLMCNACKKVLKFSVLKGMHIVPYVNDASAPPPSMADDYNDAASRQRNLGPVSYSDDYGPSFCRSCSTEGEASGVLPSLDQVEKSTYNRKMSSDGSSVPIEDRKMKGVMKEPQSENEDPPYSVESVGPSSRAPNWRKVTSEIEEVMPSSNSPLHQLMGYNSPSQVLNR